MVAMNSIDSSPARSLTVEPDARSASFPQGLKGLEVALQCKGFLGDIGLVAASFLVCWLPICIGPLPRLHERISV
jgi:hypothetical protein